MSGPSPLHKGKDRRASELFDQMVASEEEALKKEKMKKKQASIYAMIDDHIEKRCVEKGDAQPAKAAPVAELVTVRDDVPNRRGSQTSAGNGSGRRSSQTPTPSSSKTSSKKWGTHHSPADGQAAINAVLVDVDPEKAGEIYDKVTISVLWILITVIVHCAQFAFLIEVAKESIKPVWLNIIIALVTLVYLLIVTLFCHEKVGNDYSKYGEGNELRPSDEADKAGHGGVALGHSSMCRRDRIRRLDGVE